MKLVAIYQVDLALFGHVHNNERSCSVYQKECMALPRKDKNGINTYDHSNYSAPVHAVIGMAGFTLDKFPNYESKSQISSLSYILCMHITHFGYLRGHAKKKELNLVSVNADTKKVEDSFCIIKTQGSS
ncbi:hypothetical protein SLA2020_429160 [Shorea laevis]